MAVIDRVMQKGAAFLERFTPNVETIDYVKWRDRFMLNRLRLWLWLAFPCLLTFILLDFYQYQANPILFGGRNILPYSAILTLHGAMLAGLLFCAGFYHTTIARRNPGALFLCLSWSINLSGQIVFTLNGFANPDIIAWSLVFLLQATLVPVRWSLHLVSQLGVLVYFFGVNSALGLSVGGQSVYSNPIMLLYLFWLCLICNLAVYLYERLQQAEFQSRRKLRFFLHTVSHDLRSPVLETLAVLKRSLTQPQESIAVNRSLLEQMLQGSDRQLKLINCLLQSHDRLVPEKSSRSGLLSRTIFGTRFPLVRKVKHLLNPTNIPSESADYESWSHSFLLGRLRLSLWIALIYVLTLAVGYLCLSMTQPLPFADMPPRFKELIFVALTVTALSLAIGLVLHEKGVGARHLDWLFLGFSWSVTVIPQFVGTLYGYPFTDTLSWGLVFLTQATLMPVRWRLHMISQLGVMVYYIGVNLVLGSTTFVGKPIFDATLFLYLFWFCLICDLGVLLYERLQQAEIASRRHLQLFLNTITHDLRTPVMGASMFLHNLLHQSQPEIAVQRTVLERMYEGSDRQLYLINCLLEAHATEEEVTLLDHQPIALPSLIHAVLSDLEPLLTKNKVTLNTEFDANLPSVKGDPNQLWRVWSNLITNALKHNPPGLTLTLKAAIEANMIRCCVQDNGLGIQQQQCQQLFDLYSRGDRARYIPGMGLGLFICKQIIHAHGGQIGVISSPGAGATFWFTIPIAHKC